MRKFFVVIVFCSFSNCFSQTNFRYFYKGEQDALNKGRSLYESGNYKDAIAVYNDLIAGLAAEGEVYKRRGDAKSKLRDYRGAILDYNRFLDGKRYSGDMDVYYSRGIVKNKLGDFRGAIADYVESIRLFPYVETDYINKGTEKFTFEVYTGTIAYYTKQISLDPKNGFIYKCRGIVKLESGDKMSACLDFYKARDLKDAGASDFIRKYCN